MSWTTRSTCSIPAYGNGTDDAICHAWSNDGLHFERNPTNPIFHPTGDWNLGRAIDSDVIEHEGKLFLYCATRDPSGKIQMLVGSPLHPKTRTLDVPPGRS